MTEPAPGSVPFEAQPSNANFGPDPSLSKDVPPAPKVNQKNPPRSGKSVFSSLGQNKKVRSGVRKLDEKDRDKIASLYTFGAMGLMPFKPQAAQAMALSADKCADAWMELAQENDSVRRVILALVEGGVWGKVFAAHTPILIALLPENLVPPMLRGVDLNGMAGLFPDSPEGTEQNG